MGVQGDNKIMRAFFPISKSDGQKVFLHFFLIWSSNPLCIAFFWGAFLNLFHFSLFLMRVTEGPDLAYLPYSLAHFWEGWCSLSGSATLYSLATPCCTCPKSEGSYLVIHLLKPWSLSLIEMLAEFRKKRTAILNDCALCRSFH